MNPYEDYDLTISQIISVVTIQTDSDWSLDNLTTTDHWILSLSIDGKARYTWNQQQYLLQKDDLIFFQEGFSRSARSSAEDPWRFIVAKFQLAEMTGKTALALAELPNIFPHSPSALRQRLLEMESMWRSRRPGYLLYCKSALYDILYSLLRQSNTFYDKSLPHRDKLRHALERIHQNHGPNFTLEQLAGEAGLSPSYYRMLFKRFTGYSTVQYQNYIKITHARDLLSTGNYRVAEVAGMVGIKDIYYFSRMFKQMTGVAPSKLL